MDEDVIGCLLIFIAIAFVVGIVLSAIAAWLTVAIVFTLLVSAILAVYGLVLVLISGTLSLTFSILRAWQWLRLAIRSISYSCPFCYARMKLPLYVCPMCGEKHPFLWPSTYGIFKQRCNCGRSLPTMDILGRSGLEQYCAHCGRQITVKDFGKLRDIHIGIVGAPSAGKTYFMVAAVNQLLNEMGRKLGLEVEIADEAQRRQYEHFMNLLQSNQLSATTDTAPDAFNLSLKKGRKSSLLYFYDAAGEAYLSDQHLEGHKYLEHIDGMILIIDPFSILPVSQQYAPFLERYKDEIKPATEKADDVLERVVMQLESHGRVRIGKTLKLPLAVVLSKTDAFDLEDIIGEGAIPSNSTDGKTKTALLNEQIKKQLSEWGLGNLIRLIEQRFENVCYFSCSSLGRMPKAGKMGLSPLRVMEPILWVLGSLKGVR